MGRPTLGISQLMVRLRASNSRTLCLCALVVLYAAPTIILAVWAAKHQPAIRVVASILLTSALLAAVFIAISRSLRFFFLVQLPFFVLSLGFVVYTVGFGMPPAHTLALLLAGSTWEEVRGFIAISQGKWFAAFLLALTGCYLVLALHSPDHSARWGSSIRGTRQLLLLILALTVYLATNPAELIDGIALNPAMGSLIFIGGWIPSARAELRGDKVNKLPYHAQRVNAEEVHVLVVGESVRRDSWSTYGYGRKTTPYLEKLEGEAIFLQNAVADANLTEWAVPILLTGMNPEEYSIGKIHGNLVDLAKEAGYTTWWLVNQDIGISNAIGIAADKTVYPWDFGADSNGRHALDEVLLPALARGIGQAGKPRFIGVHIMGSHWEYYRRYPSKFQRFGLPGGLSVLSIFFGGQKTLAEVVDAYDNSILYTDWFLHEIVERLRGLNTPATLLYFPDHGEDLQLLDQDAGHGQPDYTSHAFEIPAFVWVNAAYRAAHPERLQAMVNNESLEIRSYNVFYTEATLMGIHWPGERDERSWASPHFTPDTRTKHIAGGRLVIRPDVAGRGIGAPGATAISRP